MMIGNARLASGGRMIRTSTDPVGPTGKTKSSVRARNGVGYCLVPARLHKRRGIIMSDPRSLPGLTVPLPIEVLSQLC